MEELMEQLEKERIELVNSKREHIVYIVKGLEIVFKDKVQSWLDKQYTYLESLSLEKVYWYSKRVEELLKLNTDNKIADRLLAELKVVGVDEFAQKYNIKLN